MNNKVSSKKNFLIFGLSSSTELASDIAKKLNVKLGDIHRTVFADEEISIYFDESVRGKKIFLIQSTNKPANTKIMELLICIDALKRSSSSEITVIMPYYGYSRQDKKTHARQSISAALIARLLEEAGADRVISFDLHSTQIQGFFKIPFDELKSYGILAKEIRNIFSKEEFIIISPDNGGISRSRLLAEILSVPLALLDKRRDFHTGEITTFNVIGDVRGKNCVIYDDIVDTGGTILKSYEILKKNGAKDVYVVCVHALLSETDNRKDVLKSFQEIGIKKFISTNSVTNQALKIYEKNGFYKIVDLTEPLTGIIEKVFSDESITDFFIEKYNKKNI